MRTGPLAVALLELCPETTMPKESQLEYMSERMQETPAGQMSEAILNITAHPPLYVVECSCMNEPK